MIIVDFVYGYDNGIFCWRVIWDVDFVDIGCLGYCGWLLEVLMWVWWYYVMFVLERSFSNEFDMIGGCDGYKVFWSSLFGCILGRVLWVLLG